MLQVSKDAHQVEWSLLSGVWVVERAVGVGDKANRVVLILGRV